MADADPPATAPRLEHWARVAVWLLVLTGWLVAVFYMWDAIPNATPAAEPGQGSGLITAPTLRTFFMALAFSAMEVAVVLAALWPWRPAYWIPRLGLSALATLAWMATVPAGIGRIDTVHRSWLAATAAFVTVAFVAGLLYRFGRSFAYRIRA